MQDSQTEITQIVNSDVILNPVVSGIKSRSTAKSPCSFFALLAVFPRARHEPCLHPLALTARGQVFVIMPGKEKRVLCGTTRRLPCQSPLPALVNAPVEGRLESSLSALFRAEKVRLSVALAGLKDLITGRQPRIYTERSKRDGKHRTFH